MKKQVYKVGQTVKVVGSNPWLDIGSSGRIKAISKAKSETLPFYIDFGGYSYYLGYEHIEASPLKPKKSVKKKETKVQELERRIKALEAHRCNPVPQVPNVPAIPFQRYYCDKCGGSYINNQGFHYC